MFIKYLVKIILETRLWLLKKREDRKKTRAERYRALYAPTAPTTGSAGVTIEDQNAFDVPSTSQIRYPTASPGTSTPHQPPLTTEGAAGGVRMTQPVLSFVDS